METSIDFSKRNPEVGVDKVFYQRLSPYAFKSTPVSKQQLTSIFDAARWSPSCYNDQPWLFITSTEKTHDLFVSLLVEANQAWAKMAPVIGFVVANRHFRHNGSDNVFFQFDSGAAWMALTLQARLLGLYTHGMGGVKFDQVYGALGIDKSKQQVLSAFVIGEINIEENNKNPKSISPRKSLGEIWQEFQG